jgi:FixJ family two-component response regulator
MIPAGKAAELWHTELKFHNAARGFRGDMESKQANSPAIAIVDDDVSVRRALARLLNLAGFQVRTYDSGESLLGEADTGFSCIVMDVHLGDVTGPEVKAQLVERGRMAPVIFISADEDQTELLSPCLKKPFPAAALIAMIWRAMDLKV